MNPQPPPPTQPRRLKIFLCHASGDKPAVRDLYHRLRAAGFDPWLDKARGAGFQTCRLPTGDAT